MTKCGEPLTAADLDHLGSGGLIVPYSQIASCDPDAGVMGVFVSAFAGSVQSGHMAFDPAKMAACRAAGRAFFAGDGGFAADASLPADCMGILVGTVAVGGSCKFDDECAGTAWCKPSALGVCSGSCADPLALGSACGSAHDRCAGGGSCAATDGGPFCTPPGSAGDDCSGNRVCRSDLSCYNSVCIAKGAPGVACTNPGSTAQCQDGSVCVGSGSSGVCTKYGALGDACGAATQPPCGDCLHCDAVSGHCGVSGKLGATCAGDGDCLAVLFCSATKCAVRPRTGQGCVLPAAAPPGSQGNCMYGDDYCKPAVAGSPLGACTRQPGKGEACGTQFDLTTKCRSGYCKGSPPAGAATCSDNPGQGEACGYNPGQSGTCQDGLSCVSGSCVPLNGAGGACLSNQCAKGAYCSADAGACAPAKAAGAPCESSTECGDLSCDSASHTCVAPCGCNVGCKGGAQVLGELVFFAAVLGPIARRRRSR
jgi:hypothetical protein